MEPIVNPKLPSRLFTIGFNSNLVNRQEVDGQENKKFDINGGFCFEER